MATVICHMMASLDGRIDCDMTSHLGSKGYYEALEALKIDTTVEGKVTALHHYASGTYTPIDDRLSNTCLTSCYRRICQRTITCAP